MCSSCDAQNRRERKAWKRAFAVKRKAERLRLCPKHRWAWFHNTRLFAKGFARMPPLGGYQPLPGRNER